MTLRGIRGATTVDQDQPEAILQATAELLAAIQQANPSLRLEEIASALFTLTEDLRSVYPAQAARGMGWERVPLMCSQEIPVPGSLMGCIRVLIHWNTDLPAEAVRHVYLHQAASSDWWPDGITYDPDNSGTPIGSLGVHEHWNDTVAMQYSRNLGTGEGIELIKIFTDATLAGEHPSDYSFEVFPNPVTENARIRFSLAHGGQVRLELFSLDGKRIQTLLNGRVNAGDQTLEWHPDVPQGIYIIKLSIKGTAVPEEYLKKIEVL